MRLAGRVGACGLEADLHLGPGARRLHRVLDRLREGGTVQLEDELRLADAPLLRSLGAQEERRQDRVADVDGSGVLRHQLHRPLVPRPFLDRRADGVGERLSGHGQRRDVDLLHLALELERGDAGTTEQVDARQASDAVLVADGGRGRGGGRRRACGCRGDRDRCGGRARGRRGGGNDARTDGEAEAQEGDLPPDVLSHGAGG